MTERRHIFHLHPESERELGFAQARRVGDTVYMSGTLSLDEHSKPGPDGDMAGQMRNIYAGIRQSLAAFDASMRNIVKETMFVTDMDALLAANSERLAAYAGCEPPATTAVEVRRLAFAGCLIEIEVIAQL